MIVPPYDNDSDEERVDRADLYCVLFALACIAFAVGLLGVLTWA